MGNAVEGSGQAAPEHLHFPGLLGCAVLGVIGLREQGEQGCMHRGPVWIGGGECMGSRGRKGAAN